MPMSPAAPDVRWTVPVLDVLGTHAGDEARFASSALVVVPDSAFALGEGGRRQLAVSEPEWALALEDMFLAPHRLGTQSVMRLEDLDPTKCEAVEQGKEGVRYLIYTGRLDPMSARRGDELGDASLSASHGAALHEAVSRRLNDALNPPALSEDRETALPTVVMGTRRSQSTQKRRA